MLFDCRGKRSSDGICLMTSTSLRFKRCVCLYVYIVCMLNVGVSLQSEVGVFPTEWLTPCVLIYAQRGYSDHFNTEGEAYVH